MKKPIIIIGAARSGTTMLGEILSQHEDVAYWVEPKYIWKYARPDINNDIRSAADATAGVSGYIKRKFDKFLKDTGRKRFMEKTPSNCFRISFIEAVFPDALYVNILRDGRDVSLSAYEKWTKRHDTTAYSRRLNSGDVPLRDFPFYMLHFFRQYLGQKLWPEKLKHWGPVTEDISKYIGSSVEEACAYQWRQSTEYSINELANISADKVLTIKYEEFLKEPEIYLEKIFEHCELDKSEAVIKYAKRVIRPGNYSKWERPQHQKFLQKISHIVDPLLERLGYKG